MDQKAARSKKAKAKDNRPARKRYTVSRRWLTNKGRRMLRTALRQPRNQQVRDALARWAALEPVHFPHASKYAA